MTAEEGNGGDGQLRPNTDSKCCKVRTGQNRARALEDKARGNDAGVSKRRQVQSPYLVFLMFRSAVASEVDAERARRVAPRIVAWVSLVASRRFGTGVEEDGEVATAAMAGKGVEEEGAGRLVACDWD